mmetsp:Transcript_8553/g.24544  ORF Transcript_8553/g.24544 Transcript_8553/m.24544 type:complete len:369 (-) Transcript_8553:85-1191(-)|eukprot:CAMPEP_0117676368 /NCGR_PEP_ID=MMETSP0804-20121206/16130_1 /TAXON_ID=1074897 /ORGANISM="Tetraselmis astigmatica, Strain CCMP880" /LENGTH=368 /DNA_ID=CAMNT_0005485491 /DNA_START=63 /DNA_END=1169 /DNA_ORIENTATION=-
MSALALLRAGTRRVLSGGRSPLNFGRGRRGMAAESPKAAAEAALAAEAAPAAETVTQAPKPPKGGGGSNLPLFGALLGIGGGVYYANQQGMFGDALGGPVQPASTPGDYGAVRKAIADLLEVEDYDDGSYGPLLVRLAWHCSGTFDRKTGLGGSNGATMRFNPESEWGANAGLHVARNVLEHVKKAHPWISYADLWTLSGAVAIEEMGGPTIPWKPGRSDATGAESCPPAENLPDASQGAAHLRDVFYRMGFNDQEIVALSGAHTLGRCHTDRSGFVNPWTFAPTAFSNLYFQELTTNKWTKKKWDGPLQYEDPTGELMMLPTDMVLIWDWSFRKYTKMYAKDEEKFFADFAAAFSKLLELGVPFPEA